MEDIELLLNDDTVVNSDIYDKVFGRLLKNLTE
jgi:hypothetical protein